MQYATIILYNLTIGISEALCCWALDSPGRRRWRRTESPPRGSSQQQDWWRHHSSGIFIAWKLMRIVMLLDLTCFLNRCKSTKAIKPHSHGIGLYFSFLEWEVILKGFVFGMAIEEYLKNEHAFSCENCISVIAQKVARVWTEMKNWMLFKIKQKRSILVQHLATEKKRLYQPETSQERMKNEKTIKSRTSYYCSKRNLLIVSF